MDNNSRYFYISGFISLSLFIAFLIAFIYMMFSVSNMKIYGYKKKNYISVSIQTVPAKHRSSKKIMKSSPTSTSSSKNIDINSLFNDVWTKKITNKVIEPKEKKAIKKIQQHISQTKPKNVESVTEKLKELESTQTKNEQSATSSAKEVNEYLAKIQDIVYQHFNVPPNSEGNSVKTVIELDPFGKLIDFRILSYSNNEVLNQEAQRIKERLKSVVFPVNPKHRSSKTIVILISKE